MRSDLFEILSDYFSILGSNEDMIRYMKDSLTICIKFWGSNSILDRINKWRPISLVKVRVCLSWSYLLTYYLWPYKNSQWILSFFQPSNTYQQVNIVLGRLEWSCFPKILCKLSGNLSYILSYLH